MEISPQSVRSTGFKTVKKGYDPDEVEAFRDQVASAIEAAQNQATAMEARARAAVAKLQEVSAQQASGAAGADGVAHSTDDAETISRTLLLAQRTADATIADAKAEADGINSAARAEANNVIDSARAMAGRLLEDARVEARRSAEDERLRAESEVQALLARREFLLSDADHLEQYIGAQRERVRDAAVALHDIVDRVPAGLADLRRPLLSASAEPVSTAPATESARFPDPSLGVVPPPPPVGDAAAATAPTPDDPDAVWRALDAEPREAAPGAATNGAANDDDVQEPTPLHTESPLDETRASRIGGDELQ